MRYVLHKVNSWLVAADDPMAPKGVVKLRVDKIDKKTKQFHKQAEKEIQEAQGRIPSSPEASTWIRCKQAYESWLQYKLGKIRNRSNLRWSA